VQNRKAVLVFLAIVAAVQIIFTFVAAAHGKYHAEFRDMFPGGAWFTAVFASLVAARHFGRSRPRTSALGTVVADLAAIVVATGLVIVVSTAVTQVMVYVFPATNTFSWLAFDWHIAAAPFFLPIAVYAWSAVLGVIGRRVPYGGVVTVPLLMIWYAVANMHNLVAAVLRIPVVANPMVIYAFDSFSTGHPAEFSPLVGALSWLTPNLVIVVLTTIAFAGCALAVLLQNQRLELLKPFKGD